MIKSEDIFEKILVNGTEIDLETLDENYGKYNVGQSNVECNVQYVLKDKTTIPDNIFRNNMTIFKAYIPSSIQSIGKNTFTNSSLKYINNNLNEKISNESIFNKLEKYDRYGDVIYDIVINEIIHNYDSPENIENIINNLNMDIITLTTAKSITTQFTKSNCIYLVKNSFSLNVDLELPENSILMFIEGSFTANKRIIDSNGSVKIIGNNSYIHVYGDHKIFTNIDIEGSWKCSGKVEWFTEGTTNVDAPKNEYAELQKALDSSFAELIFPAVKYYTDSTLVLRKPKKLVLQGTKIRTPLSWDKNINNTTVIFTNKNIDLLKIDLSTSKVCSVEIEGGNFDTSMATSYTSSVIKVLANNVQKIWGLTIKTNIIGKYMSETGIGIDLNPDMITMTNENKVPINANNLNEGYKIAPNSAYITNVRIDSDITYMGTGVKAIQWGDSNNWLTDVYISGNIRFCPVSIDTNADGVIDASLQSGKFFNERHNDSGLIIVRGGNTSIAIGSNIYDICQYGENKWSNRYAVIVEGGTGSTGHITAYGRFASFLLGSGMYDYDTDTWDGRKSLVKGKIYIPIIKESYFEGGENSEKSKALVRNFNPVYAQLTAETW